MKSPARYPVVAVSLAFLGAATFASIFLGRYWLSPGQVLEGLVSPSLDFASLIVTELRLPRAVLAIMVGASLGLSGAVLQGLTRNPLADPGLLGVSAGAALGAVVAIYFGLAGVFALATPLLGLTGALAAAALTFAFGRGGGTLALILAGAAVSGLAGAGMQLALNFAPNPNAAYEITTWLMGSLGDRSWSHVLLAAPFILVGGVMLFSTGRSLDALALGEVQAQSLGVDVERLRIFALVGTAMAVGAATSMTGAIGFIGLVAPHLVRPFVGHQPSRTLISAALLGAALLLTADVATRLIRMSSEIKLGVFTSLIGTPFFFWLVLRLRKTAP